MLKINEIIQSKFPHFFTLDLIIGILLHDKLILQTKNLIPFTELCLKVEWIKIIYLGGGWTSVVIIGWWFGPPSIIEVFSETVNAGNCTGVSIAAVTAAFPCERGSSATSSGMNSISNTGGFSSSRCRYKYNNYKINMRRNVERKFRISLHEKKLIFNGIKKWYNL